jgi:hypothetical protein
MGLLDQSGRYAAQAEPGYVLARLRPLLGLPLEFRRWFSTRSLPLPGGPDRDADLVAVADDPGDAEHPWLLIFEIQSQHDPDKARVLQLEALVFLCHARDTDRAGGEFLPLPVFVYLQGKCPNATVAVRTPTGYGFQGDPVVWEIEGDSAVETLVKVESGEFSWGAMFWISLMAGADDPDIIARWQRVRDKKVPEKSRADVSYIATVFAELVGRRRNWVRVTEGQDMTESAIANEMIELGAMRNAREALRVVLREHLPGALVPDVERAIAEQPSLRLLNDWLAAAARATTAEDFLAVLRR